MIFITVNAQLDTINFHSIMWSVCWPAINTPLLIQMEFANASKIRLGQCQPFTPISELKMNVFVHQTQRWTQQPHFANAINIIIKFNSILWFVRLSFVQSMPTLLLAWPLPITRFAIARLITLSLINTHLSVCQSLSVPPTQISSNKSQILMSALVY